MARTEYSCNALIVTKSTNAYNSIASVVKSVFTKTTQASSIVQARQKLASGDIRALIINTPAADEFGIEAAIDLAFRHTIAILLIVRADIYDRVNYQTQGTGILVLTRPLKGQILVEAANIMKATQSRIAVMAAENTKLRKRLDELGLITRAKCLLIEREHLTEDMAHHMLEKNAMDQGLSKKEVAVQIIRRYE
jgi:AmiR/NasT family two-component response regulator